MLSHQHHTQSSNNNDVMRWSVSGLASPRKRRAANFPIPNVNSSSPVHLTILSCFVVHHNNCKMALADDPDIDGSTGLPPDPFFDNFDWKSIKYEKLPSPPEGEFGFAQYDPEFGQKVCEALSSSQYREYLRVSKYGEEVAREFRRGFTPSPVRKAYQEKIERAEREWEDTTLSDQEWDAQCSDEADTPPTHYSSLSSLRNIYHDHPSIRVKKLPSISSSERSRAASPEPDQPSSRTSASSGNESETMLKTTVLELRARLRRVMSDRQQQHHPYMGDIKRNARTTTVSSPWNQSGIADLKRTIGSKRANPVPEEDFARSVPTTISPGKRRKQ
ncbi:hypothetical protein L228DRAFT_245934 [Xylona heveae TC161]|uniref:Uncharacterized protein n=1 Tax=Xylona heveae (strain CBS 132557 / TC161) TaxID=1328760 RepID=A0A161TBV5_XYLHT|nr:hypothetical protein L228DRAFT_245934 [Xylona heveae TC161]KZF23197.1 hypothetical protein L228DRAFT_245934 [Xylona heveae TC161]